MNKRITQRACCELAEQIHSSWPRFLSPVDPIVRYKGEDAEVAYALLERRDLWAIDFSCDVLQSNVIMQEFTPSAAAWILGGLMHYVVVSFLPVLQAYESSKLFIDLNIAWPASIIVKSLLLKIGRFSEKTLQNAVAKLGGDCLDIIIHFIDWLESVLTTLPSDLFKSMFSFDSNDIGCLKEIWGAERGN